MALTPRQVGETITAVQFNELVDQYEKYWGDKYPASSFSDADNNNHRYGWGIASVDAPVAVSALITADQINRLTRQVNAGMYHIDETRTLISAYKNVGDIIPAAAYNEIINQLNWIQPNRFDINSIDINDSGSEVIQNNMVGASPEVWNGYYSIVVRATFDSYTQARYYFNSGGTLSINLDTPGGGPQNDYWLNVFRNLNEIRFGANQTANVGYAAHRFTQPRGFYCLPNHGGWRDIFSYQGYIQSNPNDYDVFGGAYSCYGEYHTYGSYGGYGGSSGEYGDRAVSLDARAQETPDGFVVDLRVILNEKNATGGISSLITLESGYVQPLISPNNAILATSNAASFQDPLNVPPSYTYQFQERPAPEITLLSGWQQV